MNRRKGWAAVLLLALLLTLTGCGDEEPEITRPEEYLVGEETIPAVTPIGQAEYYAETNGEATVYNYGGLEVPGATTELYYNSMVTGNDGDFVRLNEDGYQTKDRPDFTQPSGQARIARPAAKEGQRIVITLTWGDKTCSVMVQLEDGKVESDPGPGMTTSEALAYFCGLEPDELGLEGESMDEYRVYLGSGVVFIQGVPCVKFQVYDAENPEQTNRMIGTYFLNGDTTRLYRLNDDGTVSVIR